MFDPERILGQLIASSLRGAGRRGTWGQQASWGLGALGVAMAAFDHFSAQSAAAPAPLVSGDPPEQPPRSSGMPPVATPATTVPPPLPPGGSASSVAPRRDTPPPPPPPPAGSWPTRHPSTDTADVSAGNGDPAGQTQLLIRAMIAAAYADGHLDDEERGRIFREAQQGGLTEEEAEFLRGELSCPMSISEIVRGAETPEQRRQVYAVSQLAITVDTAAELEYLDQLANALQLSAADVADIQSKMGV